MSDTCASICILCPGLQMVGLNLFWSFNAEILSVSSSGWASTPWSKDWRLFNPNFTGLGSAWPKCVPRGADMNECLYEGWGYGHSCGEWGGWAHVVVPRIGSVRPLQSVLIPLWPKLLELGKTKGAEHWHDVTWWNRFLRPNGGSFQTQARWGREPTAID